MAARPTLLPGDTHRQGRPTARNRSTLDVEQVVGGACLVAGLALLFGGPGLVALAPVFGAAFLVLAFVSLDARARVRATTTPLLLGTAVLLFAPLVGLGPLTVQFYSVLVGGLLGVMGIVRVV